MGEHFEMLAGYPDPKHKISRGAAFDEFERTASAALEQPLQGRALKDIILGDFLDMVKSVIEAEATMPPDQLSIVFP
ncbi:unnamed protein product [Vitrella brassicaformis CCMP3155]|uniref:Uncharacterized protein n=1 Tax=Vitrella brassicaformis (strain CCMP3155) TaxID=1169540 RepID=A0A0G4ECN9_VITBC|nr:unnamed protein product [Vitrella brassicaformis CCMP3155]|eukprot:CEL93739.1 unnamed protein product [Vitrella brassicaformis CCMP3155]